MEITDLKTQIVAVPSFGKLVNVPTPTIDSIVLLASIINETDYFKEGRTVERMGLSGQSGEEVLEAIERG